MIQKYIRIKATTPAGVFYGEETEATDDSLNQKYAFLSSLGNSDSLKLGTHYMTKAMIDRSVFSIEISSKMG